MNVVLVYLRMYGEVLVNTGKALIKSPWTLGLPMILAVCWLLAALPLSALGVVGGFILGLIRTALFSAYLYFVGEVVAKSNTSLAEFRKSLGVYFWSVMGLFFVIWVAQLLLGGAMPDSEQSRAVMTALNFVALFALNAAPETIYIKGTRGGIDTIRLSFQFLQEHLVWWALPNVPLVAAIWYADRLMPYDLIGQLTTAIGLGAAFHVAMVFRGTLYMTLDGSTHRQRMFRYRGG